MKSEISFRNLPNNTPKNNCQGYADGMSSKHNFSFCVIFFRKSDLIKKISRDDERNAQTVIFIKHE
jgi:hypothetical protein